MAAIDINDSTVSHFIDCRTTEDPDDLVWEKGGSPVRFASALSPSEDSLRLNLERPTTADLGDYDCRDTVTGDSLSVKLAGGLIIAIILL